MISGLDHIELTVRDADKGARELSDVLGRTATSPPGEQKCGYVRLQFDNIALIVRRGDADNSAAVLRPVFRCSDLEVAAHRLARRALPGRMNGDCDRWDIDVGATHGVPISVTAAAAVATVAGDQDILGLDHIVIRTPDAERAVALYGGRLGLDLRLDRTNPKFGSRMLFFVCGDLVVEITQDLKAGVGSGPDRIWGLAWRARAIEDAHARMLANGVAVSELRDGRRPGSQVFTVKSHTLGVPTLVIGGDGLVRS